MQQNLHLTQHFLGAQGGENARQAGNHALLVRDTHHDKPRIVSFESADRSTLVGICRDSESERSESIAAARAYARAG